MVSLNPDIVGNKVIIRACIMDSEMPYFFVWSLCIKRLVHHAVYCIILVLSLVLFMQSLYIPFIIYDIYLYIYIYLIVRLLFSTSHFISYFILVVFCLLTQSIPRTILPHL